MRKLDIMETPTTNKIPENFKTVLFDFTTDLTVTFPEYSYLWSKWSNPDISDEDIKTTFEHCVSVYPERFFDILYQTEEIFNADNTTNTTFLPNVDFKLLFNCENVSETTKKTMWKYLQLILFTIVGGIKDKSTFGETISMFDGIDNNDLQEKLNETMVGLVDFFKKMDDTPTGGDSAENTTSGDETPSAEGSASGGSPSGNPFGNLFGKMPFGNGAMPSGEKLHDHLKTLFEGKIGCLAKEMAEEISEEFKDILGDETQDIKSTSDVLKKLMKDPQKIMGLMKTVSGKLDNKMKSGEISREDIMKEAGDMFSRMKEMTGGKDDMAEMLKNMAKTMGMGKNARFDTNAMDRLTKMASTRDRMRSNIDKKKQKQLEEIEKLKQRKQAEAAKFSLSTNSDNNFVFSLDGEEKQEKSMKSHSDLVADMLIAEEENKKVAVSSSKKSKKNKGK